MSLYHLDGFPSEAAINTDHRWVLGGLVLIALTTLSGCCISANFGVAFISLGMAGAFYIHARFFYAYFKTAKELELLNIPLLNIICWAMFCTAILNAIAGLTSPFSAEIGAMALNGTLLTMGCAVICMLIVGINGWELSNLSGKIHTLHVAITVSALLYIFLMLMAVIFLTNWLEDSDSPKFSTALFTTLLACLGYWTTSWPDRIISRMYSRGFTNADMTAAFINGKLKLDYLPPNEMSFASASYFPLTITDKLSAGMKNLHVNCKSLWSSLDLAIVGCIILGFVALFFNNAIVNIVAFIAVAGLSVSTYLLGKKINENYLGGVGRLGKGLITTSIASAAISVAIIMLWAIGSGEYPDLHIALGIACWVSLFPIELLLLSNGIRLLRLGTFTEWSNPDILPEDVAKAVADAIGSPSNVSNPTAL